MTQPASETPLGGEPPLSGRFLLEVNGVEIGIFSQVSGLEVTVGTTDVVEGGQNQFTHKLPGRMTWPNLVFSRGITESNALFEWFTKTSGDGYASGGNTLDRPDGAVVVVDAANNRLRTWNFEGVFPVRWKGPSFQVSGGDVLVEELELAHHGFRAAKGS